MVRLGHEVTADIGLNIDGNRRGLTAIHGEARDGRCTPEYRAWVRMKGRCLTPTNNKFKHYGARGITVCQEWVGSYEAFLAYVGRRPTAEHSLGRIDNDRGYEPGNVRWETHAQQARNRRNVVFLEFNQRRLCIADWSIETGIGESTIRKRIAKGWTVERILTQPPRSP